MNKLKQLRQAHKLSQAALAKTINTTQQTIQRWEAGKTSIPSTALKDLAIVLNCSVDDILGLTEKRRSGYPQAIISALEKNNSQRIIAHYGGLKLQLRGLQEEFDYPVDEEAAKSVGWHLRDPEEEPHRFPWMHIETMNNYVLFINLKALKIAYLYTDNKEQAPTRYHPEVYRVLTEWDIVADNLQNPTVDEIKTEFDISDALAQAVSSLVEELKANDENWDSWEELHYIKVYWLDGTQTFHYLDEELYSTLDSVKVVADEPDVYSEVYLGISFLREEDEGGSTTFLNLDQIALIEIPAIKFWQVACECNPDSLEIRGLSSYLPLTIHLPNSSNT